MSRVAKSPVPIARGTDVKIAEGHVSIKGPKGDMTLLLHSGVSVELADGALRFSSKDGQGDGWMQAGTARALARNMVKGVSQGFERKLTLIGVGYRAQAKGDILSLSLGFSHPVDYRVPAGITVATPSQTEIVIGGCDKQKVGQVAAEIRAYRPPEPYKGKGVRYADETVIRKEVKKK
jgi:large subunit ribosomal protein L6